MAAKAPEVTCAVKLLPYFYFVFPTDWEILYSRWRPYIMADASISKERKLGQKLLKGVS
jgi:hypothetical protein